MRLKSEYYHEKRHFVERPEYVGDELFHAQFLERIERSSSEYGALSNRLLEMQQAGSQILSAEDKTDLRKKVQQCARSVLPNKTEAPMTRAWWHFIEMRASAHAEIEIRELATRVFLCLFRADSVLFSDYITPVHNPAPTGRIRHIRFHPCR